MSAKQTVPGPYRVRPGTNEWEIVEFLPFESLRQGHDVYAELRPRKIYTDRQVAYVQKTRMNHKWLQAQQEQEKAQ